MAAPDLDLKAIYGGAVDRAAGPERAAYLDEACRGDAALRDRVEALLKAREEAGRFLATAADEMTGDSRTEPAEGEGLEFLGPPGRPGQLGWMGHYEVLEVLGRGGMGIVLKAIDQTLRRVVAIKVLDPVLATSPTARRRFVREARAAAAVRDDHVVAIYAVEGDHRPPYLVMEYIAGQSLQERLDRGGALELKEVLRIGHQAACGLAAAHAQGLVHRDVKPGNILLENGVERVRITDFGLARAADDAGLTQVGAVAGTPLYMAPEQARGESVDHRADLFSFGSVLYALCTGRAPFQASGTLAVLKRVCEEDPAPVREVNPEVPDWLAAIVRKLHAKDPAQRYQSAAEVAERLGRHLAHLQDPAVAPPLVEAGEEPAGPPRGKRGTLRGRRLRVVVASVLVCSFAGLGFLEATGVTRLAATITRFFTPHGTLAIEANDPAVAVAIERDGGLVTRGAGPHIAAGITPGAFVRLGGEGAAERTFDNLADAVLTAGDGDIVEIRGNGPFVTGPIFVEHALTIRAAAGFRPVLFPDPGQERTALVLIRAAAPLVLEGLEIRRTVRNDGSRWQAIIQSRERLSIANCRLLVASHRDCLWSERALALRNGEFLVSDPNHMTPISWHPAGDGRALVENCVIIGSILSKYKGGTEGSGAGSIRLRRNTIVGMDGLRFEVTPPPPALRPRPTRAAIEVEASRNIFDVRRSMLSFNQVGPPDPAPDEALLRRILDCRDQRNVYSSAARVCAFYLAERLVGAGIELDEWNRLWRLSETGTVQGTIRFRGGDLFAKTQGGLGRLTPEDFRLPSASAGYRAGEDGEDLGADVDLVGPGPAYERWKKTPEYQQWLRETGQLK